MELVAKVQWAELVHRWLRSERERLPAGYPFDQRLIRQPDFGNQENSERLTALALALGRSPILSLLPPVATADVVSIEPGDLASLYVIPCREWFSDTGGTFRLQDAPAHLTAGRRAKVSALKGILTAEDNDFEETLIQIAASKDGPYTIIDGNNRAVALHELAREGRRELPWKAMLVNDPANACCLWHIESPLAQRNIQTMTLAFQQGVPL